MLTFQDDYPTCKETYATLCIYHDELEPQVISSRLGLEASKSQRKGDKQGKQGRRIAPVGGWFLKSRHQVESRDVRRHIVWLLDQLVEKEDELLKLQDEGYEMYISCFWVSKSGHGGPELNHEIMQRLVALRLDILFDVY